MGIPGSVMIRGFFFLKNVQNGFEHRQLEINAATYLAMSVCLRKSRLPAAFPLGFVGSKEQKMADQLPNFYQSFFKTVRQRFSSAKFGLYKYANLVYYGKKE